METYAYRARDKKGAVVTGEVVASDLKTAKRMVSEQGLVPVDVRAGQSAGLGRVLKEFSLRYTQRIKIDEMMIFNRQMQICYSVGIPILQGLKMIEEQTSNPALKKIVAKITADVSEGATLHEAMARHPRVFDPLYINLIKVGETTGELAALLERASSMIEQRAEQREKVKSATFYPKMVVGFLVVVVLLVVYVLLPKMKTFFAGFGANLPPITRLLMGTSDFFVNYWYLIAVIVGGAIMGFKRFVASPYGRNIVDRALLRLPILGTLFLQIEMNTFCVILEILLKSGVTIIDAFKLASRSVENSVVSSDIDRCRVHIERGGNLATGFKSSEVFPPFVTNLISIGEEGGSLPLVLNRIAAYYKVQVDHKLNNLSKLIEPVLLFVIFGIVTTIALAVFMPMWKMSSAMKK